MLIDDKIRDEKLQYDIKREAAKTSALSSGKTDKYEYLTEKELLPSNRSQIIEQANFTYSPLEKASEKQTEKQVDTLKSLNLSTRRVELTLTGSIFPRNLLTELAINKVLIIVSN